MEKKEKKILGPEPTPMPEILRKFPEVQDMDSEDVLDLEFVAMGQADAEDEINDCDEYLRINSSSGFIDQFVMKIKNDHFEELFSDATQMHVGSESYVTGLKIFFGLNGSKIYPVFQPIYSCRTTSGSPGNHTYVPKFGLHYIYHYIGGFKIARKSHFDKILNYRNNVEIKRSTGNFTKFDSKNDVEGVIFPFQTIYTLMNDNNENSVLLYNAIRMEQGEAKHCILLTTQIKPFKYIFEDKYANRSHLCPPCTLAYEVHKLKP